MRSGASRRRADAARAAALLLLFAAPAAAEPEPVERVALVVSGGVSLGAYQAGATYATLRALRLQRAAETRRPFQRAVADAAAASEGACAPVLRPVDLAISTGASAGNINAWLAAMTWCEADDARVSPRSNLFYDTWINVGWDKLSPARVSPRDYARYFVDEIGSESIVGVGDEIASEPPERWRDGAYTLDDGLVTRSAFYSVEANLVRRLASPRYRRDCRVLTGVTLTRAVPARLERDGVTVETQRFVVPFAVESMPGRANRPRRLRVVNDVHHWPGELEPGAHPWHRAHPEVGKALYLLESKVASSSLPEIGSERLLQVVEGSSAFPVAFAPKDLSYCAEPGDAGARIDPGDARCPNGLVPGRARFADGGFFDNIPLGMAMAFAERLERGRRIAGAAPLQTRYLYVEPGIRRGRAPLPSSRARPEGLAFVADAFEAFIQEARRYELKGLARYRHEALGLGPDGRPLPGERRFQTSSRFYPLAGTLVFDFGAFFHRTLRLHDYFVGLYDAIWQQADALERAARCHRDARDHAVFVRQFIAVARRLADDPGEALQLEETIDIQAFLYRLLHYELQATAEVGAPLALCAALVGDPRREIVCEKESEARRRFERTPVWRVHAVFERLDQRARQLARTGTHAERLALAREAGSLTRLLAQLPDAALPDARYAVATADVRGDRDEWAHATVDRLVRRAIEVERTDRRAAAESDRVADEEVLGVDTLVLLKLGRLGAASLMERGFERLDLDPSTVDRLAGDDWTFFSHFLPYLLAWDPVHGGVLGGWEPKLRFRNGWLLSVGAQLGTRHIDDRLEFVQRTALGFGYDPGGRSFDDVQLLVHRDTLDFDMARSETVGFEVAAYVLGSRLRFALGMHALLYDVDGGWVGADDLVDRLKTTYLSVGLGDLNGLFYWLMCWSCDGGVTP